MKQFRQGLFVLLLIFVVAPVSRAADDCGTITSINPYSGAITTTAIENCADPFAVTGNLLEEFNFTIHGQSVSQTTDLLEIEADVVSDIRFQSPPSFFGLLFSVYAHEAGNVVEVDLFSPPEDSLDPQASLELLEEYFADDPDIDLYRTAFITGDTSQMSLEQEDIFYDFIDNELSPAPGFALPFGTYTFVFEQEIICVSQAIQPSWWQQVRSYVIPTAHAFFCPGGEDPHRSAVTITFTQATVEPTGASSVLFLPGIQASRLYVDGALGTEDQVWIPNNNGDVRQLAMTETGESVNDIYTNDILEEVGGVINVYKGFIDALEDLKADLAINDYHAFAYDWRYSVFDVATQPVMYPDNEERLLLDEILKLAEGSYTGKVTIVAHSNGGLVAKALLQEYGDTELAGVVDKLIMVGTPQLGTPKGIAAMLHGTDQQLLGGLIIDDVVARDVIQNLPGAYSLLPSERYFSDVANDPLVTSDLTVTTESVRQYQPITTRNQLNSLLLDSEDTISDSPSINEPISLNETLLNQSLAEQTILDSWQAPDDISVYEVVGTGLPTISAIEYREFACETSVACLFNTYMKPYPQFTSDGDGTVVAGSAAGYESAKTTAVIDLQLEGSGLSKNINHVNITEGDAAQTFITSAILYPYLVDSIRVPEFSSVSSQYTIVGTHSPVTPRIVSADGRMYGYGEDGVFYQEIEDVEYFELGGSVYLLIPSTETNYTIELTGTASGPYTLTIEQLEADDSITPVGRIVATSSNTLIGVLKVTDGDFGSLDSDIDGDGNVDQSWSITGELLFTQNSNQVSVTSGGSSGTRVRDQAPSQLIDPTPLVIQTKVTPVRLDILALLLLLSRILGEVDGLSIKEADTLRGILERMGDLIESS